LHSTNEVNMKPLNKILMLLMLGTILLAGCHFPNTPWVMAEIVNYVDGGSVVQYEEVRILTQARSSQGIDKVELYIDGELEHVAQPPLGNPQEYVTDQPWIPDTEGQAIISVIAIDRQENTSDPFSIILQVVPSIQDIDTGPTSTPTVSTEELAGTQTAQASCTNSATFISHVTIPINAFVSANANFTKIWRVNNNGTCDWSGYQVVHTSGDRMGANASKALPVVKAGANADIVVDMVAPGTPGTHSAIWRIQAANGTGFGPELPITINVPELPSDTPTPTATFTLTPTITKSPTPTITKSPTPTITASPKPTSTPTPTHTATPTSLPINVQQFSEQINIPPNKTANTTVACPGGSIVVSGGFSHQPGVRVWHSMKDSNGWRIFADNNQGSARTLTVNATCIFNSDGSSDQVSKQENINANGTTQLTIICPSGSVVTGGGWVLGNNTDVRILQSSKAGNGWQISVENFSSETPVVDVYAVCLSGVSGSTSQAESTDNKVPANDTANAEQRCPTGSYVAGGGFAISDDLTLYNTSKSQNGWVNYVSNAANAERSFATFAICYSP
jgi:hypothetical protein